jgi:dipeptidyl aminopeptidase/acylaminoacyl peptidase
VQRLALVVVLIITAVRPGTSQPVQASRGTRFITSDSSATDAWPCFSPDGQTVLFSRTADGGKQWELFVVPTAGGTARPLTKVPLPISATRPDWSRRNNQIAFTGTSGDGFSAVWLIEPDGTHARALALTGLTEVVFYPTWYPDGDRMVVRDVGAQAIKRVDLRSRATEMLTDRQQILAGMAAVSPDGNWLAIAGQKDAGQTYARATNAIWLLGPTGELCSLAANGSRSRRRAEIRNNVPAHSSSSQMGRVSGRWHPASWMQATPSGLRMEDGWRFRPGSRRIRYTQASRSSTSRPDRQNGITIRR